MQEKEVLGEIASFTVRTESVFLEIIRALKQNRKLLTVDITGAFLKVLELKPEWAEFRRENGEMVVVLDKAMYGLCEAPRAWYDELTSF